MSSQTVLLFVCVVLVNVCVGQRSNTNAVCKRNGDVVSHDDFCDYYYECVDGDYVERLCPNGLAFSGRGRGLLRHCDYAHRVGCPNEETGKRMGQSPQGSGHCPWHFGIFPHEKSCTRYWHCWNGTGTLQMCPTSLLYNEIEHVCDWPNNVPGCQQHPLCNDNPDGIRAIANSCNRYWRCLGGYPRMERCSAGTAFSEEAGRCILAQEVPGCEPPPPPPPEENEEVQRPPARRQQSNFRGSDIAEAST